MKISCKLCNSTHIKRLFDSYNQHGRHILNIQDKFLIYKCRVCGCIFLGGLNIDFAYFKNYYQQDYYDNKIGFNILDIFISILRKWSLWRKENLILNHFPDNHVIKILDIGCGTGTFLENLDDDKFEKYGIEVNKEGWQKCKEKNLKVYNKDILHFNIQDKFDVITLWHVLEHLEKPIETFNKINHILRHNGFLIFATPNTNSLGFKVGRSNWFHLDSPRHLILYNQKSINYLCQRTGFKFINTRYEYYDYPLDLFWSAGLSPVKLLIYSIYPLLKLFSYETMTIVCKKST